MEPPAINLDTPFPSRAIFWPSRQSMPIRGAITDAGAAYLYQLEANGSATYLTKVTAPDGAASDQFGYSVSQSGNILAVGAIYADPGGLSAAGAAYLFQLEANGSTTYLTKVTAPDGATSMDLELRFPVGQYSGRRFTKCRSGWAFRSRGGLSFSIGSQWIRYLPDQSHRSRWSRQRLFQQSGNILAVGAKNADLGGETIMGLLIFINSGQWIRYLPI